MIITFIFIIVLIVACISVWHFAEHHELHKVRAEFDHILDHIGPSSRYRRGIELAEEIIDKMDNNFNGNYNNNIENEAE